MSSDLERAAELLKSGGLTLAAVSGTDAFTSTERGVKPLLELLDSGRFTEGFSAADKVVGKAAAFLYVLLGVHELYTGVISESALDVLKRNGITVRYDLLVPAIRNRSGTGFCPMETAVKDADSAETALHLIKNKLAELNVK